MWRNGGKGGFNVNVGHQGAYGLVYMCAFVHVCICMDMCVYLRIRSPLFIIQRRNLQNVFNCVCVCVCVHGFVCVFVYMYICICS